MRAAVAVLVLVGLAGCRADEIRALRSELLTTRGELKETRDRLAALEQALGQQRVTLREYSDRLERQELSGRLARSLPAEAPLPVPPVPPAAQPAQDYTLIFQPAGENRFRLKRADADRVLADFPTAVVRSVRIIPAVRDGRPHGFKLFGIRPGSLCKAAGLHNGDSLLAVNGVPLSGPDRALEAYSKARVAKRVVLDLERRGQPVKIEYIIDPR
jgi:general secretion pathway protein C